MKRTKNRFLTLLSFFGIVVAVCITTIGYAAYNADLRISGEAVVKVEDSIRIVGLNLSSNENDGYEQYNNNYYYKNIVLHIALPYSNSSVTYKVDIKNTTDRDYGIAGLSGLPDNLTYEFTNYAIGDKLCTNDTCNNGMTDEIYLTIKYKEDGYDSNNINYSANLRFDFERFYNVVYRNVNNSASLKQVILKNTDYIETVTIPEGSKLTVRMNGILLVKDINFTYDVQTNILTIPNTTGNIVITISEPSESFDTPITGDGRSFEFQNTEYNINEETFYLEADLSNIGSTRTLENIISIGNDVSDWKGRNISKAVNMHVYFPATANSTTVQIDMIYYTTEDNENKYKSMKVQKSLSLSDPKIFRMAFNDNGLYINGTKIFDKNSLGANVNASSSDYQSFIAKFFDYWETNGLDVEIGSSEGDTRSTATYNDINIYNKLFTDEELIEKTKIVNEEIPIAPEIKYKDVFLVGINGEQPTQISYPFQPNGNKFLLTDSGFTNFNINTVYLEIDVSNLKDGAVNENLISIGNDFSNWSGPNIYDFHVYYPYTANSNELCIALLNGSNYNGQVRQSISLINDSTIKIAVGYNGLFVNGEKWIDSTGYIKSGITMFGNHTAGSTIVSKFFEKFTYPNDSSLQFKFGSEQGDGRSTAIYNSIRVYGGILDESKMMDLTS